MGELGQGGRREAVGMAVSGNGAGVDWLLCYPLVGLQGENKCLSFLPLEPNRERPKRL
jgi:hypothetical protein